jgi:hypothetical protein
MKVRAGYEDRDLADGARQFRRAGQGFDQFPNRSAEFRKMQPGIPGPDQPAGVVNRE